MLYGVMRLGGAVLSPLPNARSALPLPMVAHAAVHLLPALAAVLKPLSWLPRALAAMVHPLCHLLTSGWMVAEELGSLLWCRMLAVLLNHLVPGLRMFLENALFLLRCRMVQTLLSHFVPGFRMLVEKLLTLLWGSLLPLLAHHLVFRFTRMRGESFGRPCDLVRHPGMPLALLSPHRVGFHHQQPTTERTRHEPHPISSHLALLFRLTWPGADYHPSTPLQ